MSLKRCPDPENEMHVSQEGVPEYAGTKPLTASEVTELTEKYGPNTIETEKRNPCYMILLQALFHPFNILLCIIAISSGVATLPDPEREFSTAIIITVMVLISTFIRFYQEWKSEGAVKGLLKLITKTVSVIRYDAFQTTEREMTITSEQLVPGDWVILRPGEVVPADGIILTSKVFFVSQSPLTGEAIPVEKYGLSGKNLDHRSHSTHVEKQKQFYKPISNIRRFFMVICGVKVKAELQLDQSSHLLTEDLTSSEKVFMGSQVITGMATMRVLRTGHDTLFGRMAEALSKTQSVNAFQKGVKKISWIFFLTMAIMVPPIFLICAFTIEHEDRWLQAFLFSLSVAVGLTPEMLPMIVNANLAKGSMALTRRHTIVKKLDAIINLGAIDILCTDKTGTLTKSVVQLSSHIDPYDNESIVSLQIGFLNSYFQSVLQNPLDSAIVSYYSAVNNNNSISGSLTGSSQGDVPVEGTMLISDGTVLVSKFSRLDELPFDFVRRRLSVMLQEGEKNQGTVYLACKGAFEEILEVCVKSLAENVKRDDEHAVFPPESCAVALNENLRQQLHLINSKYTSQGQRVLAVAYKVLPSGTALAKAEDEADMIFAGFLCFFDPPKMTAMDAVADLKKHNVEMKVLTGDSPNICVSVCNSINLPVKAMVTGQDVQLAFENGTLSKVVEDGTVFAKLTPLQKALVIQTLQNENHVVGFMGDGINDAPALKEADVGISVENGVDICRESADVVLLDKDLTVVVEGIRIGRKTYGNTIKYIAMAVSSNFGNVFSVLIATSWLPFEPMTSLQILCQNLLYDISQIAIPWDSVDSDFLHVPHKWRLKSVLRFMICMGPWSSMFDVATFAYMYFHHNIRTKKDDVGLFQTTWFTVGLLTQTLIVHIIRTRKIPIFQSRASLTLTVMTLLVMGVGLALPYVPKISDNLKFAKNGLPEDVYIFIAITLGSYCVVASIAKLIYMKIFLEWF